MLPLAVKLRMVKRSKLSIALEERKNLLHQSVGTGTTLCSIQVILSGCDMDLVDNISSQNWMEDEFEERGLGIFGERIMYLLGLASEGFPFSKYKVRFVIVDNAVCSCI